MMLDDLYEAIFRGDLIDTQCLLYGSPHFDFNTYHSLWQTRIIDHAALNHQVNIMDSLIKDGVPIKTIPMKPSILFWLLQHPEKATTPRAREWLKLHQERFLEIDKDAGLTIDHINALLGLENVNWNSQVAYGGLYPIHYGALVNNLYCLDKLPSLVNQPLPSGPFESLPFALFLTCHGLAHLLENLPLAEAEKINLNARYENRPYQGSTLAWLIATNQKYDLLEDLLARVKDKNLNLNASPEAENYPSRGVTLAWLLTDHNKDELLNVIIEMSPQAVNLNAKPETPGHALEGATLALLLALKNKCGTLEQLAHSKGSQAVDLNASISSVNDPNKGISLAWLLVLKGEFELLEYLFSQNSTQIVNLDAAPEKGAYKNISLRWMLAASKQWSLLKAFTPENQFHDLKQESPSNFRGKKRTFGELLASKNVDLLERLITLNINSFSSIAEATDYLEKLKNSSSSFQLKDSIAKAMLNLLQQQGKILSDLPSKHVTSDENNLEEFEKELKIFRNILATFNDKTLCGNYQAAQRIKANTLILFNDPKFSIYLDSFLTIFPPPKFLYKMDKRQQFSLLLIDAFSKANEEAVFSHLGAEYANVHLKEENYRLKQRNLDLENQNKTLLEENERLKKSLNPENNETLPSLGKRNHSFLANVNNKKHKPEPTKDDYNPQNSPS